MEFTTYRGPPRRTRDVRIDPASYPECVSGAARPPGIGERVHTHEGSGVVVRVLGKTGGAGRLLELTMDDGRKPPFFAADAQILVDAVPAALSDSEPLEPIAE